MMGRRNLSALILRLATAISQLAMTLAVARLLGAAGLGEWAATLALATLAATGAMLGQDVAILRAGRSDAAAARAAGRSRPAPASLA